MSKLKLLTSKIAAKLLGFTPDYIRQLCLNGTIKAIKPGHDYLIEESELKKITRKRKSKKDV
jgi:excisionase family DNA binding protein